MSIFGFIPDIGNYSERLVDRTEFDWGYISTARIRKVPAALCCHHPN